MIKKTESAVGRLAKEEQARINKQWFDTVGAAPEILEDLEARFVKRSLVKRGEDGHIDPVQMAVSCGAYEVISYIKQRIEFGRKGQ